MSISRRQVLPHDVEIEILFCGICHSDLHQAKNDFGGSMYPMVLGHEIVGKVTAIGSHVKNFKVGDLAAVGCIVDSCGKCEYCKESEEQFCDEGTTFLLTPLINIRVLPIWSTMVRRWLLAVSGSTKISLELSALNM